MSIKSARSVSISIRKGPDDEEQEVITTDDDNANWKNIIFAPFGDFWQFLLQASILINSFWIVYILAYDATDVGENSEWLYLCLELFFAIDVALFFAHKYNSVFT